MVSSSTRRPWVTSASGSRSSPRVVPWRRMKAAVAGGTSSAVTAQDVRLRATVPPWSSGAGSATIRPARGRGRGGRCRTARRGRRRGARGGRRRSAGSAAQVRGVEVVLLAPVRAPARGGGDVAERREVLPVRRADVLVDRDVGGVAAVGGGEPDVVGGGDAHLDGEEHGVLQARHEGAQLGEHLAEARPGQRPLRLHEPDAAGRREHPVGAVAVLARPRAPRRRRGRAGRRARAARDRPGTGPRRRRSRRGRTPRSAAPGAAAAAPRRPARGRCA